MHYTASSAIFPRPLPSPSLQLPSSLHTLPRHLINVTHRLPSKTEGIVFVSSAADKGFWKADMHNDSAVIASLVWTPFLICPPALPAAAAAGRLRSQPKTCSRHRFIFFIVTDRLRTPFVFVMNFQ